MIKTFEQRHSLGGIACPMGGGGGSSSSAQNTTTNTNNNDNRTVIDSRNMSTSNVWTDARNFTDASNRSTTLTDASTSTSNSNNSSTSNWTNASTNYTTDQGTVDAGKNISLSAISSNANNLDHLLSTTEHLISQQQNSMQASIDLTRSLAGTASSAYADASNQASGNKQLILAAIAVVGVVAFSSLRK